MITFGEASCNHPLVMKQKQADCIACQCLECGLCWVEMSKDLEATPPIPDTSHLVTETIDESQLEKPSVRSNDGAQ